MKKKGLFAGISLAVIILGIVVFINTNEKQNIEIPVEEVSTEIIPVEAAPEVEATEEVFEEVVEETISEETVVWLEERQAKNEKIRNDIAKNKGEIVEEEPVTEVIEEVVIEETPVEVIQPSGNASSTSFVPSADVINFDTNPELLALKQDMDAYIHGSAGGGNEHTGLVLGQNYAIITWLGLYGSHEIEVHASNGNAEVWFRCNPDEKCWNALSVIMNQVYSNGSELVSLMKDAMYNGRPDVYNVYDTPDENCICRSDSTAYGDIQTFVIVDDDIMKFAFVK